MNMRFPLLLLLSVLLAVSAGCGTRARKTSKVVEPSGGVLALESQKKFTAKDMRDAIITGGADYGWIVADAGTDTLEATNTVRGKHTVVVSIPYTATTYSIHYKDSTNMHYKPKDDGTFTINKSYNVWVRNLDKGIKKRITEKQTAGK